jgi:hypothetical protein
MKIFKQFILTILISVSIIGCASSALLHEAIGENQTLVVGTINIHVKTSQWASRTLTINSGIRITLQNITTGNNFILNSRSDGFFFSTSIPPGEYRLTNIIYSIEGNTHQIDLRRLSLIPNIVIENDKVNNLGAINGISNDNGINFNFEWNGGYVRVRHLFRERHLYSNWDEKQWINNGINRENIPDTVMVQRRQPTPAPISPAIEPHRQQQAVPSRSTERETMENAQQHPGTIPDLIILRDGNVIEARVMEIFPSEIRYKRFDHLDGPTIVILAANVLSIRYENGRVETINTVPATRQRNTQAAGAQNTAIDSDKFIFGISANAGGALAMEIGGGPGLRLEFGKGNFNAELNLGGGYDGFNGLATFNYFWHSRIGGFYLGGGLGLTGTAFQLGLNTGYKFITPSGLYFRTGVFAGGTYDYELGFVFNPDISFGWTMR